MKDKRLLTIVGLLVVILAIAVVPFIVDSESSFFVYFLFMTFCYITISSGLEPRRRIYGADQHGPARLLRPRGLYDRHHLAP